MKTRSLILKSSLAVVLVVALCGVARANVWMDENFDGTSQFVQGNGAGYPTTSTLDVYSGNYPSPITTQVGSVLTHTGAVVSTKANSGANSYQLNAGQTLACGTPYEDQTNGNFLYYQFAVNVDPIPGSATTVATFRWNFDSDTTVPPDVDFSYYIRLDGDGAGHVNIIAGEDLANSTPVEFTIGQIASNTQWVPITLQMQKDPAPTADSRNGANLIPEGMHFYSPTASAQIAFAGGAYSGASFNTKDWAWTVASGTIYLDDIYWDGGMDDDTNTSHQNLTPITPPSEVKGWTLY